MSLPKISCLCVTRRRKALLSRAIRCFQQQGYANRELLVVYESDDDETRELLGGIDDATIRAIEIPIAPKLTLGALRNLSVQASTGEYVCQWDDDDWYRSDRLEVQMQALQDSGMPACVLSRWICLDLPRRRAFVGRHRTWEGSILCRKDQILPYPELAKFEDTPMIEALQEQGKLMLLDRPDVYVYHFHGGNTWDRAHWQEVVQHARQLTSLKAHEILKMVDAAGLPIDSRDDLSGMIEPTRRTADGVAQKHQDAVRVSRYRFADQPVRLRVAGPALAEHMENAFAQLRVDEPADSPAVLDISMWDWKHTGCGCPGVPSPPDSTQLLDNGLINSYADGEIIRYERGHYVTTLDRAHGLLFSCRADGRDLALYERAKPFDMMLQRWYQDQGVQQIHAGLVSHNGRGVLFVGQGGSGKSTCTLSCALNGFEYLGDDHAGLEIVDDGCIGHSFYNAARITEEHVARFPDLAPYEIRAHSQWDHKSMLLATGIPMFRTTRSTRIAAVVMPVVKGTGPSRYSRASKVQTLIALAPTSLRGPMNAGYGGFTNLMEFIPRMPCFRLEIGESVSDIPQCVEEILGLTDR